VPFFVPKWYKNRQKKTAILQHFGVIRNPSQHSTCKYACKYACKQKHWFFACFKRFLPLGMELVAMGKERNLQAKFAQLASELASATPQCADLLQNATSFYYGKYKIFS
jgi:hypothetical protein